MSLRERWRRITSVDPITGRRPIQIFLSKPWVIILLTILFICGFGIFSLNHIMLTILHSRPEVVVPNLEGKGLMDALREASDLDLSLKQDGTEFDETLPAGTILRQAPPSGMKVRAGRPLRIVISKGGEAVFVPLVIGRPLAEAQSALAVDGLQLGAIESIFSNEHPENYVAFQEPSSGTIVTRGALIDISVSKGRPPEGAPILPDFVGQRIGMAREWAENLDMRIKIKEDVNAAGVSGTVIEQFPLPGQPLLPGDELSITVVPLLASSQGFRLSFDVPGSEDIAMVKMVARDNRGESVVYTGEHKGGEKIEVPIGINTTTRIRIFVNDILKDERVVEP